jgi:fatty-acyl-CoA synthase
MWTSVTTIGDLVDRHTDEPDSIAVVMPGLRLGYHGLSTLTDDYARSLVALGVGHGDKVGILMHNCIEFIALLIAAAKIGAISVPINNRFKAHEASYVISHADLTVLATGADPRGTDFPALVSEVLAGAELDAPLLKSVIDFTGATPGFLTAAEFESAAAAISVEEIKRRQGTVRVRDIAILMYTSGTTARPKGCLLTHESVTRQGEKVARTRFFLQKGEGFWDPLPLFHCAGIVPMIGCFSVGAKYCHAGFFEPGESLRMMADEECTVLYPAFETIWLPVINHPDFDTTDLSRVRVIQNIATPERMAQFEAKMPWAAQVTSYGSTECATNLAISVPDDPIEVRLNTLGRVVDGMEVKITHPLTGERMPAGEFGELCFRGYSCFEGYYKDPVQTAAAFDDEGYFHTGDRAAVREDGNMIYGGRLKDMLKVGGENVAAIEIEDYLARHPAVAIAQVVAVRDERYGEVAAAFVQLNAGYELSDRELVDFCIGKIATYKVPRYVRFVTEWPMSGTKVKKFELATQIAAELDRAGITVADPVASGARKG